MAELEAQISEALQKQEDVADIFAVQKQVFDTLTEVAARQKQVQPVFVSPPQPVKALNYVMYLGIAIVAMFLLKKK